jgi:hypothetical protein
MTPSIFAILFGLGFLLRSREGILREGLRFGMVEKKKEKKNW